MSTEQSSGLKLTVRDTFGAHIAPACAPNARPGTTESNIYLADFGCCFGPILLF